MINKMKSEQYFRQQYMNQYIYQTNENQPLPYPIQPSNTLNI